jgi:hypothetical protein
VAALLGVLSAIAFCAFTTGLALLISRSRKDITGTAVAVAGGITSAVWIVSFSALAAAAQSAQTQTRPDVTMALGTLHSVTLLASFATAGAVLIAAVVADTVRTRTARAVTTLIGCAGVASVLLMLDVKMDTGRFGILVVLPFFGVPVWVGALSIRLIVGRRSLNSPAVGTVPSETATPRDSRIDPQPTEPL